MILLIKDAFEYNDLNLQISIPENTVLLVNSEDQHRSYIITKKYIKYRYGEIFNSVDAYYPHFIDRLNNNNIKYKELTFVDLWEMKRNGNSFSS